MGFVAHLRRPLYRDNSLPLGVAFPTPEPGGEVNDPLIRPKPARRQRRRVYQTVVPAGTAFDDDEITGPEIGDTGGVERDHVATVRCSF